MQLELLRKQLQQTEERARKAEDGQVRSEASRAILQEQVKGTVSGFSFCSSGEKERRCEESNSADLPIIAVF